MILFIRKLGIVLRLLLLVIFGFYCQGKLCNRIIILPCSLVLLIRRWLTIRNKLFLELVYLLLWDRYRWLDYVASEVSLPSGTANYALFRTRAQFGHLFLAISIRKWILLRKLFICDYWARIASRFIVFTLLFFFNLDLDDLRYLLVIIFVDVFIIKNILSILRYTCYKLFVLFSLKFFVLFLQVCANFLAFSLNR